MRRLLRWVQYGALMANDLSASHPRPHRRGFPGADAKYEASHYFDQSYTVLAGYATDTLHRIIENLSTSHMNLLIHGFTMGWDEDTINDYISIAATVQTNKMYSGELGYHLQSFAYYKDLAPIQPGLPYPLKRASQCIAIIETVIAMQDAADDDSDGVFTRMDDGEFLPYIQDSKLRDLILHSDERTEATRIIKQRGITDADVILEFLYSDAPALSSGML